MVGSVDFYNDLERSAAKEFVRELSRAIRSARLFQSDHPTLDGMIENLRKRWEAATAGGNIELSFGQSTIRLDDDEIFQAASRLDVFPGLLFEHGIVGMVIKRGVDADEARRLIVALARDAESEGADPAALLWEADLRHVQILLDSDEVDPDDDIDSPEAFARRMTGLGDDRDPVAPSEFIEFNGRGSVDPAVFKLSDDERAELQSRDPGDYRATIRHLLDVLHRMSTSPLTPEEGGIIEAALDRFIPTLAATGDLDGITEVVRRARATHSRNQNEVTPSALHLAEHALCIARSEDVIRRMLDGLETQAHLRSSELATCLAELGPASALPFARWLARTRHRDAARDAIRVLGHTAERVLIDLYKTGDHEERSQLRPALIDLGSHDSLAAVADHFEKLPDDVRLQVVRLGDQSAAATIRQSVVLALWDPNARIRQAAIGAVRRVDGAAVSGFVREQIHSEGFQGRSQEETTALFEMIGRVGGSDLATVLADVCGTGGIVARFRRPTELQVLCLHAMRRMHAPDARAVIDEYRRKAPRAFREVLDTDE